MKNIVIGPGAMGYFAYIGAFYNLHISGKLKNIEQISGASAGSLVGYIVLALKFDFEKIMKLSVSIDVEKYLKPDITSLFQTYGAISAKHILKKELPDLKFKDFLPIKFHVATFCVERSTTVYFSTDTHPEMSALDAVSMSIAIPFIFSSEKIGGLHYIDGGIQESVPCSPFIGFEVDTFVLKLFYNEFSEINTITTYINCLTNSIIFRNRRMYNKFKICHIDIGSICTNDFKMSTNDKLKLFCIGFTCMKNYIM